MKELEAIRSLAHKMPHDGNCRYTGSDFGPCHRCQLEALLPALEKALEKRDEVMLNQGAIAATNSIVTKQEAEIAALREVMIGQYDGRALDAHDAAIRERTLQEAFSRWDQEGEQDTWNWLCETLDEEKRGSK